MSGRGSLIKTSKLNKIKRAFQKSKIKNKKAIINLNKRVYNNKRSTDLLNTSFSELIKSNPNYTIPKFFEVYNNLFYNIPKKGEKSHHSLIEQSQEYINNYVDPLDLTLERLLELLEKKDEEFNLKENPEPKEHIFYPNGTFLRTYGANTEIVEGVPQALPIWVMQEGMKREFKSYDVYKKEDDWNGLMRKLSVTVSLSDPLDYEGGNLEFAIDGDEPGKNLFQTCREIFTKGSIVVFPSYVWHRITPVTKGRRLSLVQWNMGPGYV